MPAINKKLKPEFFRLFSFRIFPLTWLVFFALVIFFTWPTSSVRGQGSDAIAFRVISNPRHISPERWYEENVEVKGSPQALTVDGYEAVRDGRTVYVNAANIVNDEFFTNIYIISYSQQAQDKTVDVFGYLLENWKFNKNLTTPGVCNFTASKSCLASDECPPGEYCLSEKAMVVRDTKRMADVYEINQAIEKYKLNHGGDIPWLESGSYLPGLTISEWPSWNAAFGAALGMTLPVDPINTFDSCPGYDPVTCWNAKTKQFFWSNPTSVVQPNMFWISNSNKNYFYNYNTRKLGAVSNLICTYMETSGIYLNLNQYSCFNPVENTAMGVECGVATTRANAPLSSAVRVLGDYESLTIAPASPNQWLSWNAAGWQWNNGQTGLKINHTADRSIKIITAAAAPPGFPAPPAPYPQYKYTITASYHNRGATSQECTINVTCIPLCPLASEVCQNTVDQRANGCGGQCNVTGTKIGSDWTPIDDPSTTCNTNTYRERNECGVIRSISYGNLCCATCNTADQPNCQNVIPANSEPGAGVCCNGQFCSKCRQNYSWNGLSCVPDSRCYGCSGKPLVGTEWNLVGGYTQTWNGSSWVPPDDPTTEYNAVASTFSCRFKCANSYGWNGSICAANTANGVCGALPNNAAWNDATDPGNFIRTWDGDSFEPATVDVTYNESQGDCRYTCLNGYYYDGATCVSNSGSAPCGPIPDLIADTANGPITFLQTWNNGLSVWEPAAMASHYDLAPGDCHYRCSNNYTWNAASSRCLPDTRDTANCDPLPNLVAYVRTGPSTFPQTWDGVAQDWLPLNLANSFGDTNEPCQFGCTDNFSWNGGQCLGSTRVVDCADSIPADAVSNALASQYTQSWDGFDWLPAYGWHYDATPGICTFACQNGYSWDSDNNACRLMFTLYVYTDGTWGDIEIRYFNNNGDPLGIDPCRSGSVCSTYHDPGEEILFQPFNMDGDIIGIGWGWCDNVIDPTTCLETIDLGDAPYLSVPD